MLSSQSIYPLSNFYLNLAKYLNEDFISYDTLLAENFYKVDNLKKQKIYNNLSKYGEAFHWYSSANCKNINTRKISEALKLLTKSYKNLLNKKTYEAFDYAEFLKNNEKFESQFKFILELLIKLIQIIRYLQRLLTEGVLHMKELENGMKLRKIYYYLLD